MRKTVLVSLMLAITGLAQAADLVVNGKVVSDDLIQFMLKRAHQPNDPSAADRMRYQLVGYVAVIQAAEKAGLDKRPDVANDLLLARWDVLGKAFVYDYVQKNPASEADLKAAYQKRVAAQQPTYKVRHILVKTEVQAKDLIAQLKKGANFATLAKKYSIDQGSAQQGGLMDYAPASTYLKPFADAIQKMKKGELSAVPVKTDFGYHVILMEDSEVPKMPSYDELKDSLAQEVNNEHVQAMIQDLAKSAKVEGLK